MRWSFPTPPSRLPCGTSEAHLSALADDALPGAARERLAGHVLRCPHCRTTLRELRETRALVRRATQNRAEPTSDLSQRLMAIARTGPEPAAAASTATRPTATPVATAPRVGVLLALLAVVAVAGIGWTNGPAPAPAMADPLIRARIAVSTAIGEQQLGSAATASALAASGAPALSTVGANPQPHPVRPGQELEPVEIAELIRQAAGLQTAHHGQWRVDIRTVEGAVNAVVTVDAVPGQGTQLVVQSLKGTTIHTTFVAAPDPQLIPAAEVAGLHARDGQRVAGQRAVVIETDPTASTQRRWWVEERTGLLLRTELVVDGELVEASGFTELTMLDEAFLSHPQTRAGTRTAAVLSTSRARSLHSHGWFCPDRVAGLSLIGARSDGATAPSRLNLTYSNAAQQITVLQQPGTLPQSLPGYQRDQETGILVRPGMPSVVTWQSGSTVFVVAGTAPSAVLLDIVADLPHDRPAAPTVLDRIGAGWLRVGGYVFG